MFIRTALQQPHLKQAVAEKGLTYRSWLEGMIAQRWEPIDVDWESPEGNSVIAWINYSNWAVNCPECGESFIYEPGELFICPGCVNQYNNFKPCPVVMPSPEDRLEVERLLCRRKNPEHRQWYAQDGETIEQVRQKNIDEGDGG